MANKMKIFDFYVDNLSELIFFGKLVPMKAMPQTIMAATMDYAPMRNMQAIIDFTGFRYSINFGINKHFLCRSVTLMHDISITYHQLLICTNHLSN